VREDRPVPARTDLDDRGSCPLQVLRVIEVADQDIAPLESALAVPDYHHSVRVDVTVGRDGRCHPAGPMKAPDKRVMNDRSSHGRQGGHQPGP
jgi:hypothetical protein